MSSDANFGDKIFSNFQSTSAWGHKSQIHVYGKSLWKTHSYLWYDHCSAYLTEITWMVMVTGSKTYKLTRWNMLFTEGGPLIVLLSKRGYCAARRTDVTFKIMLTIDKLAACMHKKACILVYIGSSHDTLSFADLQRYKAPMNAIAPKQRKKSKSL